MVSKTGVSIVPQLFSIFLPTPRSEQGIRERFLASKIPFRAHLADFLSSYLVPEADTEQWSRHLYRELSTTDPYVCKGFCTFDPECHFNAFLPEDGKCFLGNFSVVTGVSVTTDILNLDIQVMPGRSTQRP